MISFFIGVCFGAAAGLMLAALLRANDDVSRGHPA